MIPRRYAQATMRDFSHMPVIWEVGTATPRDLFLYGPNQVGKTHAAAAISRAWSDRAKVTWELGSRMIDRIGDAMRTSKVDAVCREYETAPALVLDDLGMQRQTPHVVEYLSRIIITRLDFAMPTVITSNLSPQGLLDAYGERIATRVAAEYRLIDFSSVRRPSKQAVAQQATQAQSSEKRAQAKLKRMLDWWQGLPEWWRCELYFGRWPRSYRNESLHHVMTNAESARVWENIDGEIKFNSMAATLAELWFFAEDNDMVSPIDPPERGCTRCVHPKDPEFRSAAQNGWLLNNEGVDQTVPIKAGRGAKTIGDLIARNGGK